ncbi:hypothetical protein SEA_BANQUO_5 [Gordonia phage Banquo]|nr:hypothetical protein SEA_BANQUO_5 [Gordonia phage Banquo]
MALTKYAAQHAGRFDNLPSLAKRETCVHFPLYVNGKQVGKFSAGRTSPTRWTVHVDDNEDAAEVWFLHVNDADLKNPDNPFEVVAAAMDAYTKNLRERGL